MAEIAINDLAVEARDAFAEAYFKKDLADQRAWYSQKAGLFKQRAELLALLTIMLGALITFIQVFGQAPWVPIVSGLIGAIVAVAAAWQRIARYQETWISYRTASDEERASIVYARRRLLPRTGRARRSHCFCRGDRQDHRRRTKHILARSQQQPATAARHPRSADRRRAGRNSGLQIIYWQ